VEDLNPLENTSHGDRFVEAAMAFCDHHTLVGLDSFLAAFADTDANPNGVANINFGQIAFQLGGFEGGDQLTGSTLLSSAAVAVDSKLVWVSFTGSIVVSVPSAASPFEGVRPNRDCTGSGASVTSASRKSAAAPTIPGQPSTAGQHPEQP